MSDNHLMPCSAEPYRTCVSVRLDRPTRLLTIAEAREFARALVEAARQAAEFEPAETEQQKKQKRGKAAKLKKVMAQQQLFQGAEG